MRIVALIAVSLAVVLSGCTSQNPIDPDGTLPIVGNLALWTDACRGDTLVFTWDSISVPVDEYTLWFTDNPLFVWMKAGDFPGLVGVHVADRCFTYSVWAQNGSQHSTALSARVIVGTTPLGTATTPSDRAIAGFSVSPDTIVGGDASRPDFPQDFFLRRELMGYIIYGGHADPRQCPGGRWAQLAPAWGDGFKAPEPDSLNWSDSLSLFTSPRFFIRLENGHYGRFTAMAYQNPDTLAQGEVVEVNFVYQPLQRVRLFN